MRPIIALIVVVSVSSDARSQWISQPSGTMARLRGISVVSEEIVWVSGTGGTFLRTLDGGKSWHAGSVPGASALDFRDIHGVDARVAILLSIGAGGSSRIYKTIDGGATWAKVYVNTDPKGFLDALAFWDCDRGVAMGDPVDGRFVILTTQNGGKTWGRVQPGGMPQALPGEGAFAASGTCLTIGPSGQAWLATGGATTSRVFRSTDWGRTWTVHETPVTAGTPSSGVFSLAFHDSDHGVAVGGDYKEPRRNGQRGALTSDGGRTWRLPKGTPPASYMSAVALVPGTRGRILLAVGPTGSETSEDGGETWRRLGTLGFNAIGFANARAGWAVGDGGVIAKIDGARMKAR
jgi:photosystem II stability/assembly factor-like uncharacterized protein